MTARVLVLPHEDSVACHGIRAALLESYASANAHETMLVHQIAAGYWRTLGAPPLRDGPADRACARYNRH